ncbi:ABC transporter permease [Streptosporangium amethystogenes subsp. fukuiense]|uniref:Transport permease protein n=1 Tax=Streptosporangium amethystogenes subsp. fukuiense TaxID=698418 RepID=A0ABW2SXJ6_9ACTN
MTATAIPVMSTRRAGTIRVTAAATRRSLRAVFRSPALLISPLAQSLFFLLIYSGQLSNVGAGYLGDQTFIAFLLPLILLTGVATGAGTAGTLILGDITSGYLDRLRVAHGTVTPFLAGTLIATLVAVTVQALLTTGGAMIAGYRPTEWTGTFGMLALMLILGAAVSLLSVAVAVRTASSSTTNLVTLAFFGSSFFTGVFAPVDELSGWMRAIATVNPLTYIIDTARQLESESDLTVVPLTSVIMTTLVVMGFIACGLALNHARRNR